jgi:hypothetical protein
VPEHRLHYRLQDIRVDGYRSRESDWFRIAIGHEHLLVADRDQLERLHAALGVTLAAASHPRPLFAIDERYRQPSLLPPAVAMPLLPLVREA